MNNHIGVILLRVSNGCRNTIRSVHLSSERVAGSQFMADRLKVMSVCCYAILACLKAIKSLTKDNRDELLALLDDAFALTEEIQQVLKKVSWLPEHESRLRIREIALWERGMVFCRLMIRGYTFLSFAPQIKRRAPLDQNGTTVLETNSDLQEEVLECCHKLGRVFKVFLGLQRSAIHTTISQGEQNEEIPLEKLKELTHEATDSIYGKDDNGPECLRMSLKGVLDNLNALNDKIQEGSLERDASTIIKITPPVQICAQTAKEKAKDMDQMRVRIEQQMSDIQELRKTIKIKTEEVREMALRKDMAEKKIDTAYKDVEEQRDRLQRQLDELQIQLKKKEKEFDETTEVMNADLAHLEKERRDLRNQLKDLSRRNSSGRTEIRSSPVHSPQLSSVSTGFIPVAGRSSEIRPLFAVISNF